MLATGHFGLHGSSIHVDDQGREWTPTSQQRPPGGYIDRKFRLLGDRAFPVVDDAASRNGSYRRVIPTPPTGV